VSDTAPPKQGTYEVYIDVRHYPRHAEDWQERQATAFKLRDSGHPQELVVYALRSFASDLEKKHSDEPEYQAAQECRAQWTAEWESKRPERPEAERESRDPPRVGVKWDGEFVCLVVDGQVRAYREQGDAGTLWWPSEP
jgi:hypothetical protein